MITLAYITLTSEWHSITFSCGICCAFGTRIPIILGMLVQMTYLVTSDVPASQGFESVVSVLF